MRIDWTGEFDRWMDNVEAGGGAALEWTVALLAELQDLAESAREETATFKRFDRRDDTSCGGWRILSNQTWPCASSSWFADDETVVVVLLGFDKAPLGDVWYASAATRGEAMVDQWLRQQKDGRA